MRTPKRPDDRDRAIAWRHAAHAAVCDRLVPWTYGTAALASRYPTYWDFNVLRIERPLPAGVSAEDLIAEADALQAHLAFRRFDVEDEATADALAASFGALGWRVQRLWHMLHDGSERPAPPAIEETDPAGVRSLRLEWLLADGFDDPGFIDEEASALARLPGELVVLAARDPEGEPVAYISMLADGARAEVMNAYCTPAHRGRGLVTELVDAAIARARRSGAEDVWIVADADDWPKDFYGRLGFRPVWRPAEIVRPPARPA